MAQKERKLFHRAGNKKQVRVLASNLGPLLDAVQTDAILYGTTK